MLASRRAVLKKGVFGGAILVLGGATVLATRTSKSLPLPSGLRALDARSYALVMALADRLVPPKEGFPRPEEVGVAARLDARLADLDATSKKEIAQLMSLFENALFGFLFGRRTKTFTQLTAAEQDAVLVEWRDSKLALRRTGYEVLRSLILVAYYSSPLTWPAVGYPGPPDGFHQPGAPQWRGGGTPRPEGNGVWVEQE